MRNIFRKCYRIILIYAAIFAGVFFLFRFTLNSFGLTNRLWVTFLFIFVFAICLVAGVFQLLAKIKLKRVSVLLIILAVCLFGLSIPFAFMFLSVGFPTEHVVEKDGYKLVAHVGGLMHKVVYYYDYKNFFVQGKNPRLYENYGEIGSDPIKNSDRGFEVKSFYWFDDNGDRIEHYP